MGKSKTNKPPSSQCVTRGNTEKYKHIISINLTYCEDEIATYPSARFLIGDESKADRLSEIDKSEKR